MPPAESTAAMAAGRAYPAGNGQWAIPVRGRVAVGGRLNPTAQDWRIREFDSTQAVRTA